MIPSVQDELRRQAAERAHAHPADVDGAVRRGMHMYRRKLALIHAGAVAVLVVIIVIAGSLGAVARDATTRSSDPVLDSVVVRPTVIELTVGESAALEAVGVLSDGSRELLTEAEWSSVDARVASVGADGVVTATAKGTVLVRARVGKISDVATVVVTEVGVSLQRLVVKPQALELAVGESADLTATGLFSDGSKTPLSEVRWSSADVDVASVGAGGAVTAVGEGDVQVRARLGDLTGAATVSVLDEDVTLEAIDLGEPVSLVQGETHRFTAMGVYSDGSRRPVPGGVAWSSDDLKVIRIDASGVAEAVAAGAAQVTATATGGLGDSTEVAVRQVLPTMVDLEVSPEGAELCKGSAQQQFTATAVFDDGTKEKLGPHEAEWSTDNSSVATVDDSGLATSPQNANGKAVITASSGGVSDSATVTCFPVD